MIIHINTKMGKVFDTNKYKNFLNRITTENFDKKYRGELLDILENIDNTKVQRSFSCTNTKTDIIIQKDNTIMKLRDIIRSTHNIAPYYHDGEEFGYRSYITGNMGGKHIEYPQKYTNNFGFRLSIGHETAHAKNQHKERMHYKNLTYDNACHTNEKMAWTDGYHIIRIIEGKYNIRLLDEFKDEEEIATYANIHLITYIKSSIISQIKQNLLDPGNFIL